MVYSTLRGELTTFVGSEIAMRHIITLRGGASAWDPRALVTWLNTFLFSEYGINVQSALGALSAVDALFYKLMFHLGLLTFTIVIAQGSLHLSFYVSSYKPNWCCQKAY